MTDCYNTTTREVWTALKNFFAAATTLHQRHKYNHYRPLRQSSRRRTVTLMPTTQLRPSWKVLKFRRSPSPLSSSSLATSVKSDRNSALATTKKPRSSERR